MTFLKKTSKRSEFALFETAMEVVETCTRSAELEQDVWLTLQGVRYWT